MNTAKINLQVEGIYCAGCATDMETVLNNTDGILKASVDYSTGGIDIEYDPAEIGTDKIILMIKEMGFTTRQV